MDRTKICSHKRQSRKSNEQTFLERKTSCRMNNKILCVFNDENFISIHPSEAWASQFEVGNNAIESRFYGCFSTTLRLSWTKFLIHENAQKMNFHVKFWCMRIWWCREEGGGVVVMQHQQCSRIMCNGKIYDAFTHSLIPKLYHALQESFEMSKPSLGKLDDDKKMHKTSTGQRVGILIRFLLPTGKGALIESCSVYRKLFSIDIGDFSHRSFIFESILTA